MLLAQDATDLRRNRRAVGRSLEDQSAAATSTIAETAERVHKTHKARHSNVAASFERHSLTGGDGHGLTPRSSNPQADPRVIMGSSAIQQLAPMGEVQAGSELRAREAFENVGEEEGGRWNSGRPGPDAPLIELLRYSLTQHTSPHHFSSGVD